MIIFIVFGGLLFMTYGYLYASITVMLQEKYMRDYEMLERRILCMERMITVKKAKRE